ncbi:FCD domain-containing protein [Variovorax sp. E3]|uniref:FCD domain-containing protein n=1 Tax=Variovorax sp. E3 TaxID=1914993 RepID=UPI0018DE44F7|nr:FCD domain-containing protein [Variovorax sp. E3]
MIRPSLAIACHCNLPIQSKPYATAIDSAQAKGLPQRAQDEHRAVYEAISAGDADAAGRAIKNHIRAAVARMAGQDVANQANG